MFMWFLHNRDTKLSYGTDTCPSGGLLNGRVHYICCCTPDHEAHSDRMCPLLGTSSYDQITTPLGEEKCSLVGLHALTAGETSATGP